MKKIILLLLFLAVSLYPHGGRTNAQGCHNQRGGTYHCHDKKAKKTIRKRQTLKIKQKTGKYNCQRTYCKYMSSCSEAIYKWQTCGHASLDRDHDGVPCENICPGG
jgi:hypothetical protein